MNISNMLSAGKKTLTTLEANKSVNAAFDILGPWAKRDTLGAPARIAEHWAGGSGFMEGIEKELLQTAEDGWQFSNIHKGRLAATAGTTWVAGNAGVGMIKGVFTDRNGNFDMPLVPGL